MLIPKPHGMDILDLNLTFCCLISFSCITGLAMLVAKPSRGSSSKITFAIYLYYMLLFNVDKHVQILAEVEFRVHGHLGSKEQRLEEGLNLRNHS